jgi:dihydroorotate dehydrogenase
MGWYEAVGRRVFFAMDPETAHRVAQRLLGLPLPWSSIGGAIDDPALRTELAGVPLRNPIGLAAGFDKRCAHLDALGSLGFGYVVGGTVTRRPRAGNARPRITRDVKRMSMTNAMGLPNPGAAEVARSLAQGRRTCPRFVSVADEAVDDAVAAFKLVEPLADGIELNASCPNVSWGRDRDNEAHLRALVTAFRVRTNKPVLVKLPPFVTPTQREVVLALARICAEAGADGLTASNARPVRDARLSVGAGGLSGRALWPRTPEIVADLRHAIGNGTTIQACGGVFSAVDVRACLDAGATTVQVYAALIFQGPGLPGKLTRELAGRARARGPAATDPAGAASSADG